MIPQIPELLFFSFFLSHFFSLLLSTEHFYCPLFKFTDYFTVTSTSAVEPMKQFFVVFIASIFFSSIISMWFFLIFWVFLLEIFYFFAEIFNLFMFKVCLQLLTEVFIWWQLLIIYISSVSIISVLGAICCLYSFKLRFYCFLIWQSDFLLKPGHSE